MNPEVSLIIPVYNVTPYLKRCLDSVVAQTFDNFETILVNDGSTDDSLAIINEYQDKISFRLINQTNAGLSAARNHGIKEAKGKYIVLMDSDDYVYPDYIEYLYHLIKQFKTKIASCAHESISAGSTPTVISNPKEYVLIDKEYFKKLGDKELPYQMGVSAWGRIYEKSLFDDIQYPEGKSFEDSATTYKLLIAAGDTAIGEKNEYLYYRNSNSIVQQSFNSKRFEFLDAEKKMHDDILKKYPELKESMNRRYQYALMNTLAHIVISPNADEFTKEQKEIKKQIMTGYWRRLKDPKNSKKDLFGLITLAMGLPVYRLSFKLYKKLQK